MKRIEKGENLFERIKRAAARPSRYDSSASRFLAQDATTREIKPTIDLVRQTKRTDRRLKRNQQGSSR
jgi:hypothetical protein